MNSNTDTDERVREIRERQPERAEWAYGKDIQFLLDLLDSQAADYTRPAGWQDAMQRADPCKVFITFETREHAEAFLRGLQPTESTNDAATRMRDACVDAIKTLRATPRGAAYNSAINDAIYKVESLTLDQVGQEKQ